APRQVDSLFPKEVGAKERRSTTIMHLPNLITSISVAGGTSKHIPVGGLSHICGIQPFQVPFVQEVGDILITWFSIDYRPAGNCIHGPSGKLIFLETTLVTGLEHVYIQPIFCASPVTRKFSPVWVVGHQVGRIFSFNALGHRLEESVMFVSAWRAVSPHAPYDIRTLRIAFA